MIYETLAILFCEKMGHTDEFKNVVLCYYIKKQTDLSQFCISHGQFHLQLGTVLHIIILKSFLVPKRLHSSSGKLKFCHYFHSVMQYYQRCT